MKRILIVSHDFPPQVGGAGVACEKNADALAEAGYQVTVVTSGNRRRKRCHRLYELYEIPSIPKLFPVQWSRRLREMAGQYDSVILNDLGAAMAGSLSFDSKTLQKCVVFLHGSEPEIVFRERKRGYQFSFLRGRYIRLLKSCDSIVAVSEFMKKKFLAYSGLTDCGGKIRVIYNFVDTGVFFSEKVDLYQKMNLSHREYPILLSAGRIVREKGYELQSRIFMRLWKEDVRYYWMIAGSGNYKKKLARDLRREGLLQYVMFVGDRKPEELRELYSSAFLFWQLSLFEESFGLVYAEAIACGCPVIGFDRAGVKEAVRGKGDGYLVNDPRGCFEILRGGSSEIRDGDFPENSGDFFFTKKSFVRGMKQILEATGDYRDDNNENTI